MDAADLFSVISVIPVTVTSHDALTSEPSVAVAVMVAEPTLFAVTSPFWSTVATLVLLDFQVRALFITSLGVMVADNVSVAPT